MASSRLGGQEGLLSGALLHVRFLSLSFAGNTLVHVKVRMPQ